jgi:hypothetical protein
LYATHETASCSLGTRFGSLSPARAFFMSPSFRQGSGCYFTGDRDHVRHAGYKERILSRNLYGPPPFCAGASAISPWRPRGRGAIVRPMSATFDVRCHAIRTLLSGHMRRE